MINTYGILIGVFANSKKELLHYDVKGFQKFFFDNKEKYSLLEKIGFNNNPEWIREIYEATSFLKMAEVIKLCPGLEDKCSVSEICKEAYRISVKPLLEKKEIFELESLSEEFSRKFEFKAIKTLK
ncbi:hypothetical protein COU58_00625 [Candidatus Pacearchaeota archaeon CG10_big_fil_rev_8_21_14_0_10_32_42]|nr:MAG: hypothetical protein COU58_00625 [Candidatus Pacearchaeota archaeon CG10_big_fil_rev_8_21_14_0_10_32_42]